jgi:arabinan endo-1,5-alpha-L-arabinosidase
MRIWLCDWRRCLAIGVLIAVALALPAAASAYPDPGLVSGYTMVHDPSMIIRPTAPRYVVYGTHNLNTLVSNDRISFADGGPIFATTPTWWQPYTAGLWAPDVSFQGGQYWMYYAVSEGLGSQNSAIGVATSPTGLPGSWTDHGSVISSTEGSPYNAIDPSLLVVDGTPPQWWLVFGSFWGGIYIARLDPATGLIDPSVPLKAIAKNSDASDSIEAGFIYPHNGAYYLFASFGYCCNQTDPTKDTYTIRVGRSSAPDGPYVDDESPAQTMLTGHAKTIMAAHDFVWAPGSNSVVHDDKDGNDLLVYHYLDNRLDYQSFLGINFLGWDANTGFPYAR